MIRDLHIPLLSPAERVPARFFIMPLVALIMISAVRMEAFLATIEKTMTFRLLSLASVVLLAYQLGSHSWLWKIRVAEPLADIVSDFTFNQAGQGEPLYTAAVKVGGIVTLATIVAIAAYFIRTAAASRRATDHASNVGSG